MTEARKTDMICGKLKYFISYVFFFLILKLLNRYNLKHICFENFDLFCKKCIELLNIR